MSLSFMFFQCGLSYLLMKDVHIMFLAKKQKLDIFIVMPPDIGIVIVVNREKISVARKNITKSVQEANIWCLSMVCYVSLMLLP